MKRKIKVRRKFDPRYENKIPIPMSIDLFNIILSYVASKSDQITRGNLANVRKLWKLMDSRLFEVDYNAEARYKFIKRALDNKLDDYIEDPVVLLNMSRSSKYADVEDEIIEDIYDIDLKLSEIKYITNFVADKLSYSFFYSYKDDIVDLFLKLESGEYESFKGLKDDMKLKLNSLMSEIRKAESLQDSEQVFALTKDLFETSVTRTVKKLQSPSRSLYTQMQYLNDMLGGNSFESGRFYLFLGLSGGFKSGVLLNMAYQIKMANMGFKPKDPSKRPTILYVTQENAVDETIDRLFSLACGKDTFDRMKNYTPKEAIELLKTKGKLTLSVDNNIDIVLMYKPPGSINTADLYNIIDELNDDGGEVICLIHDYIKKIRSVRPSKELRLELGNAADEFKALANEKDIVVISASQLNRDSARTIDAAAESNQADLGRMLGIANIGESWNMIENSDLVVIVNRERVVSENMLYLTFKRVKLRNGPDNSIDYFNHPFMPNEFGLVPDIHLEKSLSRKYLSETLVGVEEDDVISFDKKGRTNSKIRKNIDDAKQYNLNDLDIVFAKASM